MFGIPPTIYEFDGYTLDEVHQSFSYRGLEIRLAKKDFDVLNLLVRNAGFVVEKQSFHETVWADTFVEDGSLAVHINYLRKTFESHSGHSFIETYTRRGYKFNAAVKNLADENENLQSHLLRTPAEKVKILIADDHPLFRRGLRSMIESDLGLKVVCEAENGQTALDFVKKSQPEIIILDLNMPVLDGIQTAKIISQDYPQIKIICLTFEISGGVINILKRSNVKGFVLKDSAVSEIIMCIKQVLNNRIFVSSEILELFMNASEN